MATGICGQSAASLRHSATTGVSPNLLRAGHSLAAGAASVRPDTCASIPAALPRQPRVGGQRLAEEAGQLPIAVAHLAERVDSGGEQPTPQRQPAGGIV